VPIPDEHLRRRFEAKRDEDMGAIVERIDQLEVERSYRVAGSLERTATRIRDLIVPRLEAARRAWKRRVLWLDALAFGGILLLSAARMLKDDEQFDPSNSVLVRLARRVYPVTDRLDGERFFTIKNGKRAATPLFVTLLLVDFADVVFAVDSIPAIFAVTQDPFIVFTSNAFAILGLRSLYFAIAGLMVMFRYLKFSLIFILAFVGVKMMLHHHVTIPHLVSLGVIVGFLAIGIVASLVTSRREHSS